MGRFSLGSVSDVANIQSTLVKLPVGLGTVDWSDWLRGVVGAFIGGGAAAFGSGTSAAIFIDPAYIAAHGFGFIIRLMGGTFVISGVTSMMLYLAKKPIPDAIHTTEVTVEKTQIGTKAPTVIETVKETTVSQVPSASSTSTETKP